MNNLDKKEMQKMMISVSDAVIAQELYLCELDSFVGDGDHGVTAARGFRAVKNVLQNTEYHTIQELMEHISETLSETMGGAIGPIFGSFFEGAGEVAGKSNYVDAHVLAKMINEGLACVMLIGGAKEGDRTLVDCLAPAARALTEYAEMEKTLTESLNYALEAAQRGVKSTKDMVAKKGRAKFLAEKSRGYQDAGATSMLVILTAMAVYCAETGKEQS